MKPRTITIMLLVLAVAAVVFCIATIVLPDWLAHPLGSCTGTPRQAEMCKGYNFWSGVGSDISEITLAGAAITLLLGAWRHHNCHVRGCWRLQWHRTAAGDIVCRRHHPEGAKTARQVAADHASARRR